MPDVARYSTASIDSTQTSAPCSALVGWSRTSPSRAATIPPMKTAISNVSPPQIAAPTPSPGAPPIGSIALTPIATPSVPSRSIHCPLLVGSL